MGVRGREEKYGLSIDVIFITVWCRKGWSICSSKTCLGCLAALARKARYKGRLVSSG